MTPWQPIETAPKGGTFLVWLGEIDRIQETHVGIARWHSNIKFISGRFDFDLAPPTHWMPLPEPPEFGT